MALKIWANANKNQVSTFDIKCSTFVQSILKMKDFINVLKSYIYSGRKKKSLHHINQENIYTKVMFKVIYCKNYYFVMWPLAFITLSNIFDMDSANFRKYSAYIGTHNFIMTSFNVWMLVGCAS